MGSPGPARTGKAFRSSARGRIGSPAQPGTRPASPRCGRYRAGGRRDGVPGLHDVVRLEDDRGAGKLDSSSGEDRYEALAERLKLLRRVPDLTHEDASIRAKEADVVIQSRGRPGRLGLFQRFATPVHWRVSFASVPSPLLSLRHRTLRNGATSPSRASVDEGPTPSPSLPSSPAIRTGAADGGLRRRLPSQLRATAWTGEMQGSLHPDLRGDHPDPTSGHGPGPPRVGRRACPRAAR